MIEIKTRKFRLEEDEHAYDFVPFIKNLPRYIPGSLMQSEQEIIADFWEKII